MDTTPRDPHLPPPEVVDWLLEQTWPGVIPETRIDFQGGSPEGVAGSHLIGYQQTRVAIGVDQGGRIFLPDEGLDVLRKDQDERRAALEQKRQTCEADELAIKAKRWSQDAMDRVRESCRRL
jgi:hypothetical protein